MSDFAFNRHSPPHKINVICSFSVQVETSALLVTIVTRLFPKCLIMLNVVVPEPRKMGRLLGTKVGSSFADQIFFQRSNPVCIGRLFISNLDQTSSAVETFDYMFFSNSSRSRRIVSSDTCSISERKETRQLECSCNKVIRLRRLSSTCFLLCFMSPLLFK